jgi:hypothetical protein
MKAAIAFGLLVFFLAAGCAQQGSNAATIPPSGNITGQVVHVDFLYWKNCSYCVQMKPNVEAAASEFGKSVEVRMLEAELRGIDANVTGMYAKYKSDGKFAGFPTLVGDGNHTLVGLRSKEEVRDWLCGLFETRPANCKN